MSVLSTSSVPSEYPAAIILGDPISELSIISHVKAMGRYNLYLGAGFAGDRLNKLFRENINEEQILGELEPIIRRFAAERMESPATRRLRPTTTTDSPGSCWPRTTTPP